MEKIDRQRKHLILLTDKFPFGSGETFLENELSFLAQEFIKVFILALVKATFQKIRPVPKNVLTIPIQPILSWYFRIETLIHCSFWQGFLLDLNRKNRKGKIYQLFRICWYYHTRALALKKSIQKTINLNNLRPQETILYSYWLDEKALGVVLAKGEFPDLKTISRAHGWDVYEERHLPPFLPFRPWLFKKLDKVAVVSKKGAEYLNQKFDLPKEKLVVSYLGTDILNDNRKIKNEKYSIVSCSSLIALKRVELIIEALSLLDFPLTWTHIGDGPLRSELEKKANNFFKEKNIVFRVTGLLTNRQVREFYESQQVDLFISTSETEGLPVSMMEAQSAGIPILATNVGGVNEIVLDGKTGWLLSENPLPENVARKIKEIWMLPENEILQINCQALAHWKKEFNAEMNYTAFVKLLKQI